MSAIDTQRLEAPGAAERLTPPWVFMLLIVPFGLTSGFLVVTLAYQLDAAHVGADDIATLIALSYLPHTWKFMWAPLIDLTWTRRRWYLAATVLSAAGLVAQGLYGEDGQRLALLTVVVLIANVAVTFSGMAVEGLMAHGTAAAEKGRAAGWFQAGNLGGQGLGGGLALWLVQSRGFSTTAAGAVLALISVGCCAGLLRSVDAPPVRSGSLPGALRRLWVDLWSVARSRLGWLALLICFLPIGSGAAANLWPVLAGDWHASADTVALVNGVFGGIASALGCLVGGQLCDRLDRKAAYCLFGALLAVLAVAMSLAPHTEAAFAVFALAYAFILGMSYAGFSGVVLEAIGRGAAATKYNLLASLANMPIAYVTYIDGWAHARWGGAAMLQTEAALGLAGVAVFGIALAGTRRAA